MIDIHSREGTAVVIGAGTMGRGIAADLANAGWNVHLWDVTAEAALQSKERLLTNRPPLLFLDSFADRIQTGVMLESLERLYDAAWVVEAVAESLPLKQKVLAQIEPYIGPQTIVTSNTSGLSLDAMVAHCNPEFRKRFFGTHFLNPPRYLKLLEVIPTTETGPEILAGFVRFAEQIMGHRVVIAKDTPGFISTRLWITHLLDSIHTAMEMGIGIDTADALTGSLIGRPKSATFRMADVVGLDIIAAVAANQYDALPHDPLRERLQLPDVIRRLLGNGWAGEKAGSGFYKRDGKAILVLNPATMEYRPRQEELSPEWGSLSRLRIDRRFAELQQSEDTLEGKFLNAILDQLTAYAEMIGPEIADDVLAIDRTMQWGFGWEIGPFAIADARRKPEEVASYRGSPPNRSFRTFPDVYLPLPQEPEYIDLAALKSDGQTILDSPVASLIDLDDGVWCLEFHSKMNTLEPALCEFIQVAIDRAKQDAIALVVGNQGPHFSAGYNLSRLVAHMESGNLTAIDAEMNACQQAFLALKYAPIPVVAAPHGFTLGGGCELALHCAAICASSELAIGLPEALVGLIPCGGGTKEVLLRTLERQGAITDLREAARNTLWMVAMKGRSDNAYEAQRDGWLRSTDSINRNADRQLYEAKQFALSLASKGYHPPDPAEIPVIGDEGLAVLRGEIAQWQKHHQLTDHDIYVADTIARLLGGDIEPVGVIPEQAHLDFERQLFLELCQEPLTLARVKYLLETGKHLKN